jgi:hypothetical protein
MAETNSTSGRSGGSSRRPSGQSARTTRQPSRKREDLLTGDGSPSVEESLSGLSEEGASSEDVTEHQAPICSVAFCPICTVVTALGEARPDLVQHLLLASREVLLALRSIIDARLEGSPAPSKLEHITIE